jgi:undecaprenyl-diphosphatase
MDTLIQFDHRLFFWINGFQGTGWDYVFGWTTYLATGFSVVILYLLLRVWNAADTGRVMKTVLWGVLFSFLIEKVIKLFIDRPRPYGYFYDAIAEGGVVLNTMFHSHVANSFPSGHTALVTCIAAVLVSFYGKRLSFLYAVAGFLGITRVYVGAHFPSDVIAGFGVGLLAACMAERITNPRPAGRRT